MEVIMIFDIGKTNKKVFLFDKKYNIVYQKSDQINETTDENGDACENLDLLKLWVTENFKKLSSKSEYKIVGINVSTYGASLVFIDKNNEAILPLYNYLRPYPESIKNAFLNLFEDTEAMILETASPNIGSLSAGMQVFRIKAENPEVYKKIKYAVHLPQYIASLINHKYYSEYTSIGSHTHLWDFNLEKYHNWVLKENLTEKLPPLLPTETVVNDGNGYIMGIGIHDSSAALIPYLKVSKKPFVLISTGTWCVSMNPFNNEKLTAYEITNDALMYLSYKGTKVKSSKAFLGDLHERETKKISVQFTIDERFYEHIELNKTYLASIENSQLENNLDYSHAINEQYAYHLLMYHLVSAQIESTNLVLQQKTTKHIYVDGGFSKNEIYMYLLAKHFNDYEVYAAETAQASALGAALVLHNSLKNENITDNLVQIKKIEVK